MARHFSSTVNDFSIFRKQNCAFGLKLSRAGVFVPVRVAERRERYDDKQHPFCFRGGFIAWVELSGLLSFKRAMSGFWNVFQSGSLNAWNSSIDRPAFCHPALITRDVFLDEDLFVILIVSESQSER